MAGDSYDKGVQDGYEVGREEGYDEGFNDQMEANKIYSDSLVEDLNFLREGCSELIKKLICNAYRQRYQTTDQVKELLRHYDKEIDKKLDLESLFYDASEQE